LQATRACFCGGVSLGFSREYGTCFALKFGLSSSSAKDSWLFMKLSTSIALCTLCWGMLCGGQPKQAKMDAGSGFTYPRFELQGKLARIFTVTDCEYISGMTCRIQYNGVLPLPSQVFFTEFDERGQKAGARVRLIYPKLGPGETGRATFRMHLSRPAKIVLQGEWKGPWRDPY